MDKKNGEGMSGIEAKRRTSISGAASAAEIGEYWDSHGLADHWIETREVDLEVRAERRKHGILTRVIP